MVLSIELAKTKIESVKGTHDFIICPKKGKEKKKKEKERKKKRKRHLSPTTTVSTRGFQIFFFFDYLALNIILKKKTKNFIFFFYSYYLFIRELDYPHKLRCIIPQYTSRSQDTHKNTLTISHQG